MKKTSLLLIVILLVCSFVIPVSAEEHKYTAVFSAMGVFTYEEDTENIIVSSVTLTDAEDFARGEIIFRYNPAVLKGLPERISVPAVEREERFTKKYETGDEYTKIYFEKNEKATALIGSFGIILPLQSLGVGEHELSVEVVAYNEKEERTEYDVVFALDLYEKVVAHSVTPTIDKSKVELRNNLLYLEYRTKPSVITEKFGESQITVVVPGKGTLDADNNIPNGAYVATLYEGFVADRIQICVMEDVNCDSKITAADARLALRHSARLESLNVIQRYAADMNNDGSVTAADARLILRKAAGLD